MKVRLTKAQRNELQVLEVDTLDDKASAGHRAFVEAFGAIGKDGILELHGAALAYAANPNGAFENTSDIMEAHERWRLATSFHNLYRLAFYAAVHDVR